MGSLENALPSPFLSSPREPPLLARARVLCGLFVPKDLDSSRLEVTKAQEMTLRKRVLNLESGFKLTNVRSSPIAILFEGDAKVERRACSFRSSSRWPCLFVCLFGFYLPVFGLPRVLSPKSGEEASAVYAEVMRRFSLEPELKNLTLLYQPFPNDFLQGLEDEDVSLP